MYITTIYVNLKGFLSIKTF